MCIGGRGFAPTVRDYLTLVSYPTSPIYIPPSAIAHPDLPSSKSAARLGHAVRLNLRRMKSGRVARDLKHPHLRNFQMFLVRPLAGTRDARRAGRRVEAADVAARGGEIDHCSRGIGGGRATAVQPLSLQRRESHPNPPCRTKLFSLCVLY